MVRKETGPLIKGEMDQETKDFIKFYCSKWRSKSIFQVLLRYRAARYQDLVQLSQQVVFLFIITSLIIKTKTINKNKTRNKTLNFI